MPYTPQLNESAICSLRRLAWHENKPMTQMLHQALSDCMQQVNARQVCKSCQDKTRCDICAFRPKRKRRKKACPS